MVLKINGYQTRGLLDSGSSHTIARKLNLKLQPVDPDEKIFLFAAQGAKLLLAIVMLNSISED